LPARTRISQILLWYNVVSMSIWFGGTIFQMLVIVPLWSSSPPESVRTFFQGTDYMRTIYNFFGPPFMLARALPLLLGAIVGWHLTKHRVWLAVPVVCMLVGVVMTLGIIYPINDILFVKAGGDLSADSIRGMARQWILLDRIRFAIMSLGFFSLLRALSIPFSAVPPK